jgi:colicin import membrane protein
MQFIYRILNITGIWIGVILLSIVIPEYNSEDAPSDKDEALSYGLFSLVGGIFFYYKFYTRRKREDEEQRKLQQEIELEAKRKAELEKKKKLEFEAKILAEIEAKRKAEEKEKIRLAKEKEKIRLAKEKEKIEKLKAEKEAKIKAEQQARIELENNSYYYEELANGNSIIKGPFSLKQMEKLLQKDEISLLTKTKFGLNKKILKPLKEFKEFTSGLEDFL